MCFIQSYNGKEYVSPSFPYGITYPYHVITKVQLFYIHKAILEYHTHWMYSYTVLVHYPVELCNSHDPNGVITVTPDYCVVVLQYIRGVL